MAVPFASGPDLGTNEAGVRRHAQEMDVSHGVLSGVVEESKYYITLNSMTGILTARWKRSDR